MALLCYCIFMNECNIFIRSFENKQVQSRKEVSAMISGILRYVFYNLHKILIMKRQEYFESKNFRKST